MDAEYYYIQGVAAIKRRDVTNGRKYLLQSLEIDADNDQAWVWMTRTTRDRQERMNYVQRALAINPQNTTALRLQQQLTPQQPADHTTRQLTRIDKLKIARWMNDAQKLVDNQHENEAVDLWLQVLDIQHDHTEAMKNAVSYFMAHHMMDEVRLLLYNAVEKGTDNAMIWLSARDLAFQDNALDRYDQLNLMISKAEWVTSKQILQEVERYVRDGHSDTAIALLQNSLTVHPDDAQLLNQLAKIYEATGRETLALQYYERIANRGIRSKIAQEADKRLALSVPILTDQERGSLWMAGREVLGVVILFFLLAWQDAGLNLATMEYRWGGILLAFIGGYMLVTATSSPQQQPLARLFGGHVPDDTPKTPQRKVHLLARFMQEIGVQLDEKNYYVGAIQEPTRLLIIPEWVRWCLGMAGVVLLLLAFSIVLPRSIGLIQLPEISLDSQFWEAMAELRS